VAELSRASGASSFIINFFFFFLSPNAGYDATAHLEISFSMAVCRTGLDVVTCSVCIQVHNCSGLIQSWSSVIMRDTVS
jgi:ABC-type polysaccharide/polyol phosphate export permease